MHPLSDSVLDSACEHWVTTTGAIYRDCVHTYIHMIWYMLYNKAPHSLLVPVQAGCCGFYFRCEGMAPTTLEGTRGHGLFSKSG